MLLDAKGINVYDVMNSNKLIITEAAVKAIEEVLALMAHITDVIKKPGVNRKIFNFTS